MIETCLKAAKNWQIFRNGLKFSAVKYDLLCFICFMSADSNESHFLGSSGGLTGDDGRMS